MKHIQTILEPVTCLESERERERERERGGERGRERGGRERERGRGTPRPNTTFLSRPALHLTHAVSGSAKAVKQKPKVKNNNNNPDQEHRVNHAEIKSSFQHAHSLPLRHWLVGCWLLSAASKTHKQQQGHLFTPIIGCRKPSWIRRCRLGLKAKLQQLFFSKPQKEVCCCIFL